MPVALVSIDFFSFDRKIAHWFRHSRSKWKILQEPESSVIPFTVGVLPYSDATGVAAVVGNSRIATSTGETGGGKRAATMISPTMEMGPHEDEPIHRYRKAVSPSPSQDDLGPESQ